MVGVKVGKIVMGWELEVSSLQSAVFSQQSSVGSLQSAVSSLQSAVSSLQSAVFFSRLSTFPVFFSKGVLWTT